MEVNFGFGFRQHRHLISPNPNFLPIPIDSGYLNTEPVHSRPTSLEDFTSRNLPFFPFSELQQLKASEPNNSWNWFESFDLKPHLHHGFAPVLSSVPEESFHAGQLDSGQQRIPAVGSAPSQKMFLVFDQSGDKTTLLYSSGVDTPIQFGASWVPNPPTSCHLKEPRDSNSRLRLCLNDDNIEGNSRDVLEDEMSEDTEEIDALLCSYDDSDFSDDDETSTGHSPSTMTDNGIQKLVEEIGEEVDSFSVPTKRQKLLGGGYNIQSNRYSGSSLKTFACSALESDAESSCGNRSKQGKEELSYRSGGKRSRKEKIQETVSILQSIIPNAKGEDAIVVIDEALHYLKCLKFKAKNLGPDAI